MNGVFGAVNAFEFQGSDQPFNKPPRLCGNALSNGAEYKPKGTIRILAEFNRLSGQNSVNGVCVGF